MKRVITKIGDLFGRDLWYILLATLLAIVIVTHAEPSASQSNSQSTTETKPELVDLEQFSDAIANLESKWENDYESYFQRNFTHRSRSAKQIARRLKEVREQAGINPAVIWAVPQEDFLQLMLVTPERQFIMQKIRGANRDRLTKRIEELSASIQDRQSLKYLPPARIIYSWFFKPLEPYLEAENIDTLLLCPGPNLRSLPFAALHDGEQFVVEKYNIARIPAFSLIDTSYETESNQQVLAMGTSEFEELPSLPGVEVELNTIIPKLWSGRKIVGRDFTVENFVQAHQQGNFDIAHIASHARFVPGSPADSYIQFSDRKLNLDQIAELNLDSSQIDLLVLSACETAMGNESAEYGFAGLAMQAGVKSALASLWSIDDAGTVVLMSNFYRQLKSTAIKSAALKQAQIDLLERKVYVDGNRVRGLEVPIDLPLTTANQTTPDFSHPFYWAGFTIIGNPW